MEKELKQEIIKSMEEMRMIQVLQRFKLSSYIESII